MQTLVTKTHFLTFVLLVASAFNAFAQLGSSSSDLVYTPLTPCRIVDTRNAGGAIPAGTARGFKAWGASFAAQGGSATDCGIPQSTNVAALALNMVVIGPAADGWIAAYPFGGTLPNSSTLNYLAGAVLANGATVKVSQASLAYDWNLHTTSKTHFVADVTGYYSKPVSVGSLECETLRGFVLVLANSSLSADKICNDHSPNPSPVPPFIMTGGGCDFDFNGPLLVISKSTPNLDNTGWFCRWQNTTAGDITAFVNTRCCRIPGR
jgi:hypothetical protein